MTIHHGLDGNAAAPGVTLRLAEEYRKLGHELSILSFDDLPNSIPAKARPAAFPLFVSRWLSRRRKQVDVLDASTGDAWLWARRAARRTTTLTVCRSHGLEHTAHLRRLEEVQRGARQLSWKYPLYHGGYRLWEVAQSLRHSDLALLLNQEDLQYAVDRLGVPRGHVRLVQNGIPESFLGLPLNCAAANDGNEIRIAQVGRYSAMKGIAYGCKALDALLSRHAAARVHFVGTGVAAEQVRADFSPGNRARITVTEKFDNATLPAILRGYHIKFFPTLSEGFSLALTEAMACGLAPVTTTAPGPGRVVRDGHNGLLVPAADAVALEGALEKLIGNPDLLSRLRRNAHVDAQAYAWSRVAQDQLGLYEEFLGRKRGNGI